MTQVQAILSELAKTMSQEQIADAIGSSQSKVSRWLGGQIPAGVDDALKLIALAESAGIRKPLKVKRAKANA